MIEHIVLFKWQQGVDIAAIITAIKTMKGKIPGLLDIIELEDFSCKNPEFQHAIMFRFTDRQALEDYGPHPVHEEVVHQFILPHLAENFYLTYAVTS